MSLLDALPKYTLGYPLGDTFKIILYLFYPPFLLIVLYMTLIATDCTLVYLHTVEGNSAWGAITCVLICCPAIAGFIFTSISSSRWPKEKCYDKENLRFLGRQIWYFFGFPLAVLTRYITRIFWSLEALFAHLRRDELRLEEALQNLLRPNNLELYFFLQAYLHCAPQIIFQFHILLKADAPNGETARLQLLSISACLLRMAITTMAYQRFERRKVLGNKYPWAKLNKNDLALVLPKIPPPVSRKSTPPRIISNYVGLPLRLLTTDNNNENQDGYSEMNLESNVPKRSHSANEGRVSRSMMDRCDILENNEGNTIENDEVFYANVYVSKNNNENNSENEFENDDLLKHHNPDLIIMSAEAENQKKVLRISIIPNEDVELKRIKKHSIVTDMSKYTTPPVTPAPRPRPVTPTPRPSSIAGIKERILTNAEAIIDKIPHRTYKDEPDLPVRVNVKTIKGIGQDDGVGKFVSFLSWFLFITSRMLALATFSYFYFNICLYLTLSHYALMTFLLIFINSWSENKQRKLFYFFLGYIYVFCIIEFKMKYRKVKLWYGLYFVLVSSENFLMTAVWFWSGSWETWWFGFMALIIVFSSFMSYMTFLVYFLILKPPPEKYDIEDSLPSTKL